MPTQAESQRLRCRLPPAACRWAMVGVALCGAACGQTADRSPSTTPASRSPGPVDPAKIERARRELPPGYEVAGLSDAASPPAYWGLAGGWVTDPPQCRALVAPVEGGHGRGWSASGRGGIVYAVVTGTPTPIGFDPAVVGECGQWSVESGRTSGVVRLVDAPHVEGAQTLGMTAALTTAVEGGTKTHSQAYTFTAAVGDHLVFVTVVTDPGSPEPPLGGDFAAELLVKTVSALRG